MARREEILTVYGAGVIQGVALVTFPAASAVFTSSSGYALSSSEYGAMFLPQAVMAIAASWLGAAGKSRLGTKGIYLLGLTANLLAMTLLVLSRFVMREHSLAYGILLGATACMGVGFGFTVPALNTLAAGLFPKRLDTSVLALNALLGLGTALAPVFVALFVTLGMWWGLPVVVGTLLAGLLVVSARQKWSDGKPTHADRAREGATRFPARFWIFATFVLLYGVCETMNGNWASLYLTQHFGASAATASLGLALFWGTVTAGRVVFAVLAKWLPARWVFRVLPFVVAGAFLASARMPAASPGFGLVAFVLAGLGCSALLPLAISFGQKKFPGISAAVAGRLIGFYQIGYGIAAFGVGPLQSREGLDLSSLFGFAALIALALAAVSIAIARNAFLHAHR